MRTRSPSPSSRPVLVDASSGVVYDLADTDGPSLKIDEWAAKGPSSHLAAARAAAGKLRIELNHVTPRRGSTGAARPGRVVEINRGLPAAEEVATLAHEYGHVLLDHLEGRKVVPHDLREGEAEAVAYIVLRSLGVRSKAPEYLLFHGVTPMKLRSAFKLIGDVAHRISGAILGRKKRREAAETTR